jgi:hypothetical protein
MLNNFRFVELEGVDLLIGMMVRYKESAKLQRQAAWAVLSLCGTDEISRLVALRGGDSAIMNAMLHHRYASWCIPLFLGLVFSLLDSFFLVMVVDMDVGVCCVCHPRRPRFFHVVFGVVTCSAATWNDILCDEICFFVFRFDAGVQQFGCWALSNLALSGEEVLRKMKKKGAVEVCTRTHTMCGTVFLLCKEKILSLLYLY